MTPEQIAIIYEIDPIGTMKAARRIKALFYCIYALTGLYLCLNVMGV